MGKGRRHFQQMQQEGAQPDSATFVVVQNACASMVALQEGRCVHEQSIRGGCQSSVSVGTRLVPCMQNVGV